MTGAFSLLGLLHPDGVAERVTILGGACPTELASSGGVAGAPADLVVVAPSAAELGMTGWLDAVVASLPARVAPDGIAYLLVPAGARRGVRRRLRAAGLMLEDDMLHLPSWAGTKQMVPLQRNVVASALRSLGVLDSSGKRVLATLLAVPGVVRLAAARHGGSAVVVRHRGARPLFAWLFHAAQITPDGGTAIMRAKWRAGKGSVVVQALGRDGRGLAVAKTTLTSGAPDGRTEREVANLGRLGPTARVAGALVPAARLMFVGEQPVMVADAVPGESAAELLVSRRLSVETLLDRIASWLEAWSRSSAISRMLTREWLECAVLGPARLICPGLDQGARYMTQLEAHCANAVGTTVPFVATHGDLTMSNLLVRANSVGVVDWEAAQAEGLPLRDFWYAAVDAVAAIERYTDRPAAFARCSTTDEGIGRLVAAHAAQLARAIALSDDFATLSFHACWLQHAVDEQRKRAPGQPRPFRAIVQSIALRQRQFAIGEVAGALA